MNFERRQHVLGYPKWVVQSCFLLSAFFLYGKTAQAQTMLSDLGQEISEFVHRAGQSVVTILAEVPVASHEEGSSLFSIFSSRNSTPDKNLHVINVGTGLYLNDQGYVATRSSVVEKADFIRARFYNGDEVMAELIGVDEKTGLALLRVSTRDIKLAPVGNPERMQPGSWVIIIGNSMGVASAVSMGNVSAIHPNELIQVAATVNPGNNGSPVLNAEGNVIGIVYGRIDHNNAGGQWAEAGNSALVLPITHIYSAARKLVAKYNDTHGWLGITVFASTEDYVHPQISKIERNSPAEKASLAIGDVIIGLNRQHLTDYYELRNLVKNAKPGDSIAMQVLRAQDTVDVTLEVGHLSTKNVFEHLSFTDTPPGDELQFSKNPGVAPTDSRLLLEQRLNEMEKQIQEIRARLQKKP